MPTDTKIALALLTAITLSTTCLTAMKVAVAAMGASSSNTNNAQASNFCAISSALTSQQAGIITAEDGTNSIHLADAPPTQPPPSLEEIAKEDAQITDLFMPLIVQMREIRQKVRQAYQDGTLPRSARVTVLITSSSIISARNSDTGDAKEAKESQQSDTISDEETTSLLHEASAPPSLEETFSEFFRNADAIVASQDTELKVALAIRELVCLLEKKYQTLLAHAYREGTLSEEDYDYLTNILEDETRDRHTKWKLSCLCCSRGCSIEPENHPSGIYQAIRDMGCFINKIKRWSR